MTLTAVTAPDPHAPQPPARLATLSRTLAGLATALGAVIVLGWVVPMLRGELPSAAILGTKLNAAIALTVSGVALWRMTGERLGVVGTACAATAALIGGATLAQYVAGVSLGIDNLLIADPSAPTATTVPGRMSPLTAVSIAAIGSGVLLAAAGRRGWAVGCGGAAFALAALNLLEQAYDASAPAFLAGTTAMALGTAIGIGLASASLLTALPTVGFVGLLSRDDLAGTVARRVMMVAAAIAASVGWLRLNGERAGLFDTAYGVSLTILANLALFAAAVWWLGRTITRLEAERAAADAERRLAADRLQEVADELARSNRELQEFASAASHDLQEPLRKIQAFGDRLARRAEGMDESARDYLDRMVAAAERMQNLITDLLAFSRVASRPSEPKPIALRDVAVEILDDLEQRVHDTGGSVRIGELPVVEADPLQMRQLFQNLIGNALKYHRPDAPPEVDVSAATDGGWVELRVADNGIGFEQSQVDRVFAPFQRLHGRGEYEGTGMGLAICRRIAERHGGTITATSAPGVGSTFVVRLPVRAVQRMAA